ncbi:enoyl-CoA hydratase-related protein [Mesobacterium pallidum]|uniref:enoyl-CoA hydratase-related protein n=1 Tax=Mesobacterium pallidum TaxID=2872037 RepID=UPI001EE2E655|nr:enoyl-CoA hydratase-related protein [Mesobacterium pallidum]
MTEFPDLKEFRLERTEDGIVHMIFDAPGRSMNVFSNRAIHEAEAFADWLKSADVKGVVIYSGKDTAFCAGADLSELSSAYEMIMSTPEAERDAVTVKEYSPIGRAFRKLETAGKPVAVAVNGLALGGGCELALACHYRVLTDAKGVALGLPESLVGLLPGGGGTQRMPRVVGIGPSLPILLEAGRFTAQESLDLGLAHEVVASGQEVAAAEAWIRSNPDPRQPWDRADWRNPTADEVKAEVDPTRSEILRKQGGHYPAEPAILDCLYRGLVVDMDEAVAVEIDIFKDLVQRIEPRNMIAAQFLGRVEFDRRKRKDALPDYLDGFTSAMAEATRAAIAKRGAVGQAAAKFAGITIDGPVTWDEAQAAETAARLPQWFLAPRDETETTALAILSDVALAAETWTDRVPDADRNMVDCATTRAAGFPGYLGGPFLFLAQFGAEGCRQASAA